MPKRGGPEGREGEKETEESRMHNHRENAGAMGEELQGSFGPFAHEEYAAAHDSE